MCEAILSLIGVLIGGILTLLATWFSDRLRKKDERRKKELEVLNITMSHYFSLLDKLKNESYWNHHLGDTIAAGDKPNGDFIDFYYNSFSKMRSNNKSNEILFISLEKRKYIDKIDDNIYKWIRYAEEKSVCNLPKLYQELTTDIEKLAILCK